MGALGGWGRGATAKAMVSVLAALVAPRSAEGQTDASAPGKAQVIEKIERGAFALMEAGPVYLVAPDAAGDYGLEFGASLHVGFDLFPILNLSLGASAVVAGSSEIVGGTSVLRDRLYITPSLRAQVALLTTERDFVWVRAEGGLSLLEASENADGLEVGPSLGGALGYEYFTTLRHFSIGLQAGLTAFLEPDLAYAIFVMPGLKYSF